MFMLSRLTVFFLRFYNLFWNITKISLWNDSEHWGPIIYVVLFTAEWTNTLELNFLLYWFSVVIRMTLRGKFSYNQIRWNRLSLFSSPPYTPTPGACIKSSRFSQFSVISSLFSRLTSPWSLPLLLIWSSYPLRAPMQLSFWGFTPFIVLLCGVHCFPCHSSLLTWFTSSFC